jgi:hypothetical protein
VARFGRLDSSSSSSSGIYSYACSLVQSELSWWDSKALCIYMSHTRIMAVTTVLYISSTYQGNDEYDTCSFLAVCLHRSRRLS